MPDTPDLRQDVMRWLREGRVEITDGTWRDADGCHGRLIYGEIDGFVVNAQTVVRPDGREGIASDIRVRAI